MDKNTAIGWFLIAVVFIGFTWYSKPSQTEIDAYQRQQDSLALVEKMAEANHAKAEMKAEIERSAAASDTANCFYASRNASSSEVTLQNNLVAITLNTRGAMPQKALIKSYGDFKDRSQHVVLFDKKDVSFNLTFDGKNENLSTNDLTFSVSALTDSSVVLSATTTDGSGSLSFVYSLQPDSYMLNLAISADGLYGFFHSNTRNLNLEWNMHARQQEKGYDFENRYASITYKEKDGSTDYLSETSNENEQIKESLDWIAFKNQFFSCVMIAPNDFTNANLISTPESDKKSGYIKQYDASMQTAFDPKGKTPTLLQFYFGPNDFHLLQTHNKLALNDKKLELEELVYLGWPLFRWINRWIVLNLFDLLRGWGLHMGVVLLLITLIMKILVYPATKKSFISSARMRVLKPKIDEVTSQFTKPEDAMKKQQAVMSLYSQYGVSPMGGCLPMLIQMPIWIALFNFVPNAIQLRGESFLWADDLSAYDELLSWGTDLWLIGDHLSIFCLLFCITNIFNSVISMKQQQSAAMSAEQEQQMKMMRWMMLAMPVMFFFMFNNYSSGLNYYYFLSGLTSILMMWYLRHTTDDTKLLNDLERRYLERKAKGTGQGGGAFGNMANLAQHLQELQRMQEEKRRGSQNTPTFDPVK